MLTDTYSQVLIHTISQITANQKECILQAAELVKDTIARDGLIYVFGCGHSHMLAEETFYRAGGLACVSPIFYEPLMLHEGAANSSVLEKSGGLAEKVLQQYAITDRDVVFCISTSGVNGVPVEFASALMARGIPVIGIASDVYLEQTPKNSLGKHLQEVCTLCIHNYAPHGDACLQPEGLPVRMTPVSTVAGAFIINSVLAEATQMALSEGIQVPVYMSGNVPGGAEFNRALIEKYQPRIRHL